MPRINAIDKLKTKKRKFVESRLENKTIAQSAMDAGVSKRMGSNYEKDSDVQAAYRQLMRKAIPARRLVNLVKGGTEATIPVYDMQGRKKKDRADWKTRRGYIEIAAEHGGYFEKKVESNATLISVRVEHVGAEGGSRSKPIPQITAETIPAS